MKTGGVSPRKGSEPPPVRSTVHTLSVKNNSSRSYSLTSNGIPIPLRRCTLPSTSPRRRPRLPRPLHPASPPPHLQVRLPPILSLRLRPHLRYLQAQVWPAITLLLQRRTLPYRAPRPRHQHCLRTRIAFACHSEPQFPVRYTVWSEYVSQLYFPNWDQSPNAQDIFGGAT